MPPPSLPLVCFGSVPALRHRVNRARNTTQKSPATLLPLWDFWGANTVSSHGLYFKGFSLAGLDGQHLDEIDRLRIADTLYEALLFEPPERTLLQFRLVSTHENVEEFFGGEGESGLLGHQRKARKKFLEKKKPSRQSLEVYVGASSPLSTRDFQTFDEAAHTHRLQQTEARFSSVRRTLARAGLSSKTLSEDEVLAAFSQAIAPGLLPLRVPDLLRYRRRLSPREMFFRSPLSVTEQGLRLGSVFAKVLSLKSLPEATHFGLMDAFLDLPPPFALTTVVSVEPQAPLKKTLRFSKHVAHANAHKSAFVDDPDRALVFSEAQELTSLLAETKQRLFTVSQVLVLFDQSEEALQKKTESGQDLLARSGLLFVEETGRHEEIYFRTLPGMCGGLDRKRLLTSNNAVDLLPLFTEPKGDRGPILVLRTKRGRLHSFDPVEEKRDNHNACVFGASGAGKSVFMNTLIAQAMRSGPTKGRTLVVDFAGEKRSSYKMIAELLGGEFVPIAKNTLSLNPFPKKKDAVGSDGKISPKVLTDLLVILDLLLSNTDEDKESTLYGHLLRQAIFLVYERTKGEGTPTLVDLEKALENQAAEDPKAATLKSLLSGFVRSPEAALFLAGTPASFSSPFLVFDLFGVDHYKRNIQEAVTYLVCRMVQDLAFDETDPGQKYIILDEVAQLLRRKQMVGLVHALYSTARKHNTSVWTVTQRYGDYVESAVAGTIALNSTTQVLLSHAHAEKARQAIVEDFSLSPREQEIFASLSTKKGEYAELLLRTEVFDEDERKKKRQFTQLKLELSPFEYQVATSDAEDRRIQADYFQANPKVHPGEILLHLAGRAEQRKRRIFR